MRAFLRRRMGGGGTAEDWERIGRGLGENWERIIRVSECIVYLTYIFRICIVYVTYILRLYYVPCKRRLTAVRSPLGAALNDVMSARKRAQ